MTKEKFPSPKGWLNIQACKIIYEAFRKNASTLGLEPPSYDFSTAYSETLEGILGSIELRARFTNQDVIEVATSYFVKIAKSQAFLDANKRMAVVLMGTYLIGNGYVLQVHPTKMIEIAVMLVKDRKTSIEKAIKILTPLFKRVVRKYEPKE